MTIQDDVIAAEGRFFSALVTGRAADLEKVLTDDFVLISVMDAAAIPRRELVDAIASKTLTFSTIDPAGDPSVRIYGTSAVTVGDTTMRGQYTGQEWETKSRYTHVFVQQKGVWKLASAQGTPLP
jgi:hypothetical protein